MLEQGPDFWCWFDTTQFSYIPLCSPNTCKYIFNPNVTTFQSNCAEGLHFSAFILEARKKDGTLQTLYHLVAGLVYHLRQSSRFLDMFRDAEFSKFHASLDAQIKHPPSEGWDHMNAKLRCDNSGRRGHYVE